MAKEDINDLELAAISQILNLHKDNVIEVVTSPVAKAEEKLVADRTFVMVLFLLLSCIVLKNYI